LARFQSVQAHYTIAARELEREIIPALRSESLGLMVWSPLAGGLLSGKYKRDGETEKGSRRSSFDFPPVNKDRAFACIDVMRGMADRRKVSVAQIALAWLLHQPAVTSVIIGVKRMDQLEDDISATSVRLDDEELVALDEVSKLPAEYPGWMFERQGAFRRKQLEESRNRRGNADQ
jgi:aryl-alcohol dehydrogenase-like predicted oxidoreductase